MSLNIRHQEVKQIPTLANILKMAAGSDSGKNPNLWISEKSLQGLLDTGAAKELRIHGITTCSDILQASSLELMTALGRSHEEAREVITSVCRHIAPKPRTAKQLYERRMNAACRFGPSGSFVPTSVHKLDAVLQGGLACGTITEVAGPPGCGKTQFCMTVCSSAVAQECSVIYIDTEAAFTAQRFLEISSNRWTMPNVLDVLSSKFHLFRELTCADLQQRLSLLEDFIVEHNIKLIVVDSIASLVRKEFESTTLTSVTKRSMVLSTIASMLKYYAHVHGLAVLVVNQISTRIVSQSCSDRVHGGEDGGHFESDNESTIVTVALGDTWAHTVNSRLVMEYYTQDVRKLTIVKSPLAPRTSLACRIQAKGIVVDWQTTGMLQVDSDIESDGLTVQSEVFQHQHWHWH